MTPDMTPELSVDPVSSLAVLVGAVLLYVGVLRWLRALLDRCQPLEPEATLRSGGLIFLAGAATLILATIPLGMLFGLEGDAPAEGTSALGAPLAVQSLAALWAGGVMLALAARQPRGVAGLGLVRPRGPSAPAFALTAWLAFLPVFLGAGAVSYFVLSAFGREPQPQSYIQDFLADGEARRSVLIWAAVVVVNPLFEELAFRGALYGALRRRAPPWVAMVLSAVLFAALHEFDVTLQVACLGLLLAWAYERTGSLMAPCLIHMLHNGVVLIMVATGWLEV